jgi:hypothetical protein
MQIRKLKFLLSDSQESKFEKEKELYEATKSVYQNQLLL